MTQALLQIEALGFGYPEAPPLVSNWSGRIDAGVTLLYGDTGSGKSTLLRVLAGTPPALPAKGRLTLAGVRLDQDAAAYRRDVFFVDPGTDAYDAMSCRECTDALVAGDARFDAAAWQALVDAFSLAPHLEKKMFMLSTGSKRKVWLAAGLATGRALTLLDEPTGGLDGPSRRALWDALTRITAQPDRAVVVASGEHIGDVEFNATLELPFAAGA
ncbi:MAG: ATP-binding cassette domain-containing protein [Pseudomonadota bacterium]